MDREGWITPRWEGSQEEKKTAGTLAIILLGQTNRNRSLVTRLWYPPLGRPLIRGRGIQRACNVQLKAEGERNTNLWSEFEPLFVKNTTVRQSAHCPHLDGTGGQARRCAGGRGTSPVGGRPRRGGETRGSLAAPCTCKGRPRQAPFYQPQRGGGRGLVL